MAAELIRDGTSLEDAATALADRAGLPVADVKTALRIVGFLDQVLALGEVIQVLSLMRTRFQALLSVVPNLPRLCWGFDLVGSLDFTICEKTTYANERHRQYFLGHRGGERNFLEWLFFHYSPQTELAALADKSPLALDVLAIWWIYGSAARHFGDQIPQWRRKGIDDQVNPNLDIEIITVFKKGAQTADAIETGAANAGYSNWLSQVATFNERPGRGQASADSKAQHTHDVQLLAAIDRLVKIKELDITETAFVPVSPMPGLDERQLLKSHWYFPRPSEFKKLQGFLEKNLEPGAEEHFEGCLVALAIFSSRTVGSVLQWPICTQPSGGMADDRIEWIIEISQSFAPYRAAVWRKAEHGKKGATTSIFLPFELLKWLGELNLGFGSPRLADLLPMSQVPWEERAYACLANALDCNVERAEVVSRDLIPRLVYHDTSNSALVRFWRSSFADQLGRGDRIALNHYLQIGGRRSLESFNKACKSIFGKYSMAGKNAVHVPLGRAPLTPEETGRITRALKKELDHAKTMPEKQGCFGRLALFASAAGTGHRRRTTPFPFPWDFNLSERLVFIADKLITGSEARFVPLAPGVIQYLEAYANHLRELALSDQVGPAVRAYARLVAAFISSSPVPATQAATINTPLSAGVFFSISSDGNRVKKWTLSTHQLDLEILRLTGIERVVQRLRPTLAHYLWENGASGRAVQTFLGHQPELHSHGPSSSWSVRGWADGIEPSIQKYLVEYGIASEEDSHAGVPRYPSGQIPPLKISTDLGYEGRQREREWAQQRARTHIRRELNEHVLSGNEIKVTEADLQRITSRVKDDLQYDPVASSQISGELKKQLAVLRRRRSSTISAASAYLGSTTPGPVGIEFSRSLRCASVFRHLWELNVGTPIGAKQFDHVERLAHLAISLVCFDGVLLPLHLQGILDGMAAAPETLHGRGIALRCQVISATHDYHFSVLPGPISTALSLGVEVPPAETDALELWPKIHDRAALILRKLMNPNEGKGWDLQQLCLMFKPYWLIRQSGAMYAIAIGDYRGPAADPTSEANLLHGSKVPPAIKLLPRDKKVTGSSPRAAAYRALRKFFTVSRGVREKGERRRRKQRAALRAALDSELAVFLTQWRSETQVVDLLFSFIGRLLDKGGRRVKNLAFSSLEKYFSLVAKELIELGWDTNFESIGADELTALLENASQRISDKAANSVLAYFNTHLRDEVGAPYCGPTWSDAWDPVRVRSSLILPRQAEKAIALLQKEGSAVSLSAALLISLCFGYGLRTTESLGLSAQRFDLNEPDLLYAQRTQIADLKSHNGRRAIPASFNPDQLQLRVREAVLRARASPHKGQYLFEDSTGDALISNVNACISTAIEALRLATGNTTAIPYHLRHSFGTTLVLGIFAKKDDHILHGVVTRLLGPSYRTRIRNILQAPADWPFALNVAGLLMGHGGVATLLNTYFHASSLVISEGCSHWQPTQSLPDARLAAMVGRERSSITKMRLKLPPTDGEDKPSWRAVVRHLVRKQTEASTGEPETPETATENSSWELSWVLFSRALTHRLESNASIEEMAAFATDNLGVPAEMASRMSITYRQLVINTGLDDFEPLNSELIRPVAARQRGVIRGMVEREEFLAKAQRWNRDHPEDHEVFGRFMSNWNERVDPDSPRIVCLTQQELDEARAILTSLGAAPTQLLIGTHGNNTDPWLHMVRSECSATKHSPDRASRGNKKVLVNEVSITISQKKEQGIPDGRDFHRALISLHLARTTGTYDGAEK